MERNNAQNKISEDIIERSGVDFDLSVKDFKISEIVAKNYENSESFSFWESLHHKNLSFWILIFGCFAFIICICIWMMDRYYMNQNKMIDGTYPKNEPDLINQIEDMFI